MDCAFSADTRVALTCAAAEVSPQVARGTAHQEQIIANLEPLGMSEGG